MGDFIRARSECQKQQRLDEIKTVAARQFSERPYHEITLTTIADELGWSRASLYKYVSTKEEVFLELTGDARSAYYDALVTAFPLGCGYSREVACEVWTGIVTAHTDWFRYSSMLFTIIETNVTVERLMEFKRAHYDRIGTVQEHLSDCLGVDAAAVAKIMNAVNFHGVGLVSWCATNPLVAEALDRLGIDRKLPDFRTEMREFIAMCVDRCAGEAPATV